MLVVGVEVGGRGLLSPPFFYPLFLSAAKNFDLNLSWKG